jgi:hypothetical protein
MDFIFRFKYIILLTPCGKVGESVVKGMPNFYI